MHLSVCPHSSLMPSIACNLRTAYLLLCVSGLLRQCFQFQIDAVWCAVPIASAIVVFSWILLSRTESYKCAVESVDFFNSFRVFDLWTLNTERWSVRYSSFLHFRRNLTINWLPQSLRFNNRRNKEVEYATAVYIHRRVCIAGDFRLFFSVFFCETMHGT